MMLAEMQLVARRAEQDWLWVVELKGKGPHAGQSAFMGPFYTLAEASQRAWILKDLIPAEAHRVSVLMQANGPEDRGPCHAFLVGLLWEEAVS